MKLVYADLFSPFLLDCDRVNVITVEDGSFFYKLVNEFRSQCEGHDGGFVLSENNSVLNIAKMTDMMHDFITFDVNTKRLLTKLYSKLETECNNELYEATTKMRSAMSEFLSGISGVLRCDIDYSDQAELKSLFKCFDLKFGESGERISDKVVDYMLNSHELDGRKLFVTVGLLDFMSHSEAELFFRTVTDHKLYLLMFENRSPDHFKTLNRLTIDEDYCVF